MNGGFQVDAFILAGGASSRMGRAKSLLDFGGVPLILRTAQIVQPLARTVTVVGSPERHAALGLQTIPDADFGIDALRGESNGPLVGVATALSSAQLSWNLIVACDLPFLTTAWIACLLARAKESNAQVVLPETVRGLEPLAAVYRAECALPLAQCLTRGVRKMQDALMQLRLDVLTESDWRKFDRQGLALTNMNTPYDYECARARLDSRKDVAKA